MKPAACIVLLLLASKGYTQFSILPQIGFDNTKASVKANNQAFFSPLGYQSNLKATIRADYRLKGGYGPFIGLSTGPAAVQIKPANPSDLASNFKAFSAGTMQWRLEAGYQYSSKPIQFKSAAKKSAAKKETPSTSFHSRCGAYHGQCGRYKQTFARKQPSYYNLRIQPSVGIAYLPDVKNNVITSEGGGHYLAGNWKAGLVAGMGFELGKGKQRLATLSVYYTKGFTNMGNETVNTSIAGKTSSGSFSSKSSGWALTLGVPFQLSGKEKTAPKPVERSAPHNRCGYYHSRTIMRL